MVSQPYCLLPAVRMITLHRTKKQNKDNIPAGATVFTGTSQPDETTRTAILNHTKGAGASVNWSSTGQDMGKGRWRKLGSRAQQRLFLLLQIRRQEFLLFLVTYTGTSHDILYTNMAVTGTQPQVEIKTTQTQSAPNNFDHAGESGDCGIATGSKAANGYDFTP